MKVPLFSPAVQNDLLAADLKAKFHEVLESGYFILGGEVESFEREAGEYLGAEYAIGVSSGTDALLVALMALGIGPGDEVIVPAFTFFATAGVVQRVGATPVFGDVCLSCYQIRPEEVERRISEKTKAVIPVHLFGHAADLTEIQKVLSGRKIAIIEDVAQSMGVQVSGRHGGTVGDLGCFSFFPTKNLGGFGDGGMVTTQNADLAEKVRRLRNHGMHPKYYHAEVGGNFRLDALQAALLRIKLPHLDAYVAARQSNAEYYMERLPQAERIMVNSGQCCHDDGSDSAEQVDILLPLVASGQVPTWNQFTVRVQHGKRDALHRHLIEHGVGAEVYYPVPLHQQQCFAAYRQEGALLCTELLCSEVLSLPIYPELEPAQLDYVIETVHAWVKQ
ncbi:MAG: DegT/DnrJ/EryC1/StrS family aminotransferase [Verrucomicrobiota bacterium]